MISVTEPSSPRRSRLRRALVVGALLALSAGWAPGQTPDPAPGNAVDAAVEPAAEAAPERRVERHGDLVSIFSGDIHVPASTRQRGVVVCVGGDIVIEGEVTQDVVVILGSLELSGTVGGQVTGIWSDVALRNAEVGKTLVTILGDVELENSTVHREMVNVLASIDRDDLTRIAGQFVNIGFGAYRATLFWVRLFHKFILFVLILILVALVPERIRSIGEEAPVRYAPAFFVGLLAYLGMLVLLSLLLVTVVGMPVAQFAFYVLKWMGVAGIFYAVGRRIGRAAGFEPSMLGAVLLVFAVTMTIFMASTSLGLVGLLAWGILRTMFWLLVEVPAVGLVLLTRFGRPGGGRPVPPAPSPASPPPVEPARPAPPAPPPVPG